MTHKRLTLTLLAVLAALLLAGCGVSDGSAIDSSSLEGIQTFGTPLDPEAQPSMGQVIEGNTTTGTAAPDGTGTVDEQNSGSGTTSNTSGNTSGTTSTSTGSTTTTTTAPASSKAPSNSSSGSTSTSTTSPSPSRNIDPPAPASTATIEEVEAYIGKSLSELVADVGYPTRSDYEYIDETDPDKGEIGTLFFDGFTATTRRDEDGEIVTAVTPGTDTQVEETPLTDND
jgi:hypothetical protein